MLLGDDLSVSGESFNFGPQDDASQTVAALLDELKKSWEEATWKVDPTAVGAKKEAVQLRLNCDKALNRMKWKALLSFEEAVKMTSDWYRAYCRKEGSLRDLTIRQIHSYEALAVKQAYAWALS
jgi:CDP-glucose 4,6-dehydratase